LAAKVLLRCENRLGFQIHIEEKNREALVRDILWMIHALWRSTRAAGGEQNGTRRDCDVLLDGGWSMMFRGVDSPFADFSTVASSSPRWESSEGQKFRGG
jgi:hypothetical protein